MESRTLPAVEVETDLAQGFGLLEVGGDPAALVEINGRTYIIQVTDLGYRLHGRNRRGEETIYDLPADLTTCDCGDYTFRCDRRVDHACKHISALKKLKEDGRLSVPGKLRS